MSNVLYRVIEHLEEAKRSAALENASFGFPNDRIEIKSVHSAGDERGHVGDLLHPTEYVRNITRLHHGSWIISPINAAIELLKLHADTLQESEKLIEALDRLDIQRTIQRAKAGISA